MFIVLYMLLCIVQDTKHRREPSVFCIDIFCVLDRIDLWSLRGIGQLKNKMIYNCTNIDATTTECISQASTSPTYVNGFSYGEVYIGFLLFLIFLTLFSQFVYNGLIGQKQKPKHYE